MRKRLISTHLIKILRVDYLTLRKNNKLMDTIFSLCLFTAAYGLLILSIFPDKYFRKIGHNYSDDDSGYLIKYASTMPIIISFLGGYVFAAVMVNFCIII